MSHDLQAQRLAEIDDLLRECQLHGMSGVRVSYAQLMAMRGAIVHDRLAEAIATLDRLARGGCGPVFTQRSVGAGYAVVWIGETTDDLCEAIVELGKMAGGAGMTTLHEMANQVREGVVMAPLFIPLKTEFYEAFAHLSHVLRIETTDLKTKIILRRAIRANLGREAYLAAWARWSWKKPVERQAARRLAKWKRRAVA